MPNKLEEQLQKAQDGDANGARFLEALIDARGLYRVYLAALAEQIEPDVSLDDLADDLLPTWRVLLATPQQRARAFLVTIKTVS
jgi:hypothetical protein